MSDQKTKVRKTFNYLIRASIILVTYGFIYHQVFVDRKLKDIPAIYNRLMEKDNVWMMAAVILFLMLVNWGLEAVKWRLLINKIEKVSFLKSFKGVLAGVSVSVFTPNRTGDYLGRVFILEKGNHVEGILITIIGSFAQLIVTVCLGLFALLNFTDQYIRVGHNLPGFLLSGMILVIPAAVFVILLVYFNIRLLADFLGRYLPGKWESFARHAVVFQGYSTKELLAVFLYSLARYIVFSTQFYLLLWISGAEIPILQAIILIPVVYLIMALIPSIALADLGIRGSVSIFVIGMYFKLFAPGQADANLAILAASSVLWFVNLVIPSVLGTFFVLSLKFFRK
jgi:hypothetical protein